MHLRIVVGMVALFVAGCRKSPDTKVAAPSSTVVAVQQAQPAQAEPVEKSWLVREPTQHDFDPAKLKPFTVEAAQSEEMIAIFGASHRPQFNNDRFLLFSEGRYVDGPYVPRHNGLTILVNDTVLTNVMWPSLDYVAQAPEMPADITVASTFDTMAAGLRREQTWLHRTELFHASTAPPNEIAQRVADAVRQLPFVDSIVEHPPTLSEEGGRPQFTVTTKQGERFDVNFQRFPRRPDQIPPVRGGLKNRLDDLELWIKRGGFVSHLGDRIVYAPVDTRTWRRLPRMFEFLESKAAEEAKNGMVMASFGDIISKTDPYSALFADRFVRTFQPTDQLRQRLATIPRVDEDFSSDPNVLQAISVSSRAIINAEIARQTDDADNRSRTDWREAIHDMIRLLEAGNREEFLNRYTHPIRQHNWKTRGASSRESTINSLKQTAALNVRHFRQVLAQTPAISPDGQSVFVTIFVDKEGYREYSFFKLGKFWYRGM